MLSNRGTSFRGGRGVSRLLAVLPLAGFLALGGCHGLLNVKNPNNVNESDLQNPVASAPQANGALAAVANGVSYIIASVNDVGDEITQAGSRDAWRQLTFGNLDDSHNEFSDAAWPQMAQGRWMADEAIKNLSGFDQAGTLTNRDDLSRSYLYGAIIYDRLADWYEDTVIGSDHMNAAPPVGPDNMVQLYDTALAYVGKGMTIAQSTNNTDLQLTFTAMKAQIYFHQAVWHMLHPPGQTPANPLVNDPNATAAAQAFFAMNPPSDWMYRFTYSANTVSNYEATVTNEDIYTMIDTFYVYVDASGKHPASVRTLDPIDGVVDPALNVSVFEFSDARNYAPITVVSWREMHLILAEAALAQGDMTTFDNEINAVRSVYKLSPYTGQVPAQDMLIYERRSNLFLQGFRLADMYRFGIKSPEWQTTTAAYTKPGTFFPIAYSEQLTNCHIAGGC
jgi:starch-binding outer membrane protein, SusD/RagB family